MYLKQTLIIGALATCVSVNSSAAYNVVLGFDIEGDTFTNDSPVRTRSGSGRDLSVRYYLDDVDDSTGPLGESGFLHGGSYVQLRHWTDDNNWSSFYDTYTDSLTTFTGEWHATSAINIGGQLAFKKRNYKTASNTDHTWQSNQLWLGYFASDTTEIGVTTYSIRNTTSGYTWKQTSSGFWLNSLFDIGGERHIKLETYLGKASENSNDDRSRTLMDVNSIFYFTRNFGLGLGYAKTDYKTYNRDFATNTFNAKYFIGSSTSVSIKMYSRGYANDGDTLKGNEIQFKSRF